MSADDELLPPVEPGRGRRARRRAGEQRPPVGRGVLLVLALVSVLLAVALVVDVVAGPVPARTAAPVAQGQATSGTWYCPAVAPEDHTAVLALTAVGNEPSRAIVQRYADSKPKTDDARVIQPGATALIDLAGADVRAPSSVSWSGGPLVATWRMDGPEHSAAAPCEAHPSQRWYIPGFATVLGSTSRLHLFNPFPGSAVVRVTFGTPRGPDALALTDNIVVPANGTKTLNLADFKPQLSALAANVEVLVGRVVAQGELRVRSLPRQPGTPGLTLLPAARAPAERWSFGYARVDESSSRSWLHVLNPSDRPAAIEVRVTNPLGKGSALLGEFTAPGGAITRIELADASRSEEFGVDVEVVNAVPVVVSRTTALSTGGGPSLATSLGTSSLATEWALTGGGTRERDATISVYNPGPEPATVSFLAPGAPQTWSDVRVGPNGRAQVLLSDASPDRRGVAVRITSDVPVVAEIRSLSASGTRLWTAVGIPAEVWVGPPTRPSVQLDPTLPTRLDPSTSEAPTPGVDDLGGLASEEPAAPPVSPTEQGPTEAPS